MSEEMIPQSEPGRDGEGMPVQSDLGEREIVVGGAPMSFAITGWIVAAACLLITGVVWMGAQSGVSRPADPIRSRSLQDRRQGLIDSAQEVVTASWIGVGDLGISGLTDHPLETGVGGEVVWSDSADEGYMRISGIAPNDPGEFQYQLWIFDATRPVGELPDMAIPGLPHLLTQRPVDGGVFDVGAHSDGTVIVVIDAKLPVGRGTIFVVTKERPGGVVVSDREIVFLAVRG